MNRPSRLSLLLPAAAAASVLAAGCGSSSSHGGAAGAPSGSSSPSALSAEAKSAATGDIPDNQNFLTFKNAKAGYSMVYPEGWSQTGAGRDVTFRDKNNIVHVVVASGAAPTPASVTAELAKQRAGTPTLKAQAAKPFALKTGRAVKVSYTTQSAPNPVTGKRVTLMVDRYELAKGGKRATVDLATPTGVDNVDAYRMMIQSFRWK